VRDGEQIIVFAVMHTGGSGIAHRWRRLVHDLSGCQPASIHDLLKAGALGYVLKSDVYRTASPAVTDTDDRSSTQRMDM
jgi:hypothetical protein